MNTLPTKWYIQLTPENYDEVKAWWLKRVEKTSWAGCHLDETCVVLSVHPNDNSYYWSGGGPNFKKSNPSYQEITLEQFRAITNPLPEHWYFEECKPITLEQFRQITNSTPTQKPMTKSIQISRDLLNEYYEAATGPQKAYLTEHFKLDGTTTDEAIRQLYEMACSTWKPRIKKNHPECFSEDSKYFDFSGHVEKNGYESVIPEDAAESLGLNHNFIRVRHNPKNKKTHCRSFYLDSSYNWELVQDGAENGDSVMALIPTKKQKF